MNQSRRYKIFLGSAAFVAPLAPVAVVVACGGSEEAISSEQQQVLAEQSAINLLTSNGGNRFRSSTESGVFNREIATEFGITGFSPKANFTYAYRISGERQGSTNVFFVLITVSLTTRPSVHGVPQPIRVEVMAGVKRGVEIIQEQMNTLIPISPQHANPNVPEGTPFTVEAALQLGFSDVVLNTNAYVFTYSTSGVGADGSYTVSITVGSKSFPGVVGIPKPITITARDSIMAAVNAEQLLVNNFTPEQVVATKPIGEVLAGRPEQLTPEVAAEFGLSGLTLKTDLFTYTLSHPALAADGPLSLLITVVSKQFTSIKGHPTPLSVHVSGVSKARVDAEQLIVNGVKPSAVTVNENGIAARNNEELTAPMAALLGIDQSKLTLHTTEFAYHVTHGAMSADGDLSVLITVNSKSEPTLVGTPKAIIVAVQGITAGRVNLNAAYLEKFRTTTLTEPAFRMALIDNKPLGTVLADLGLSASVQLPYPDVSVSVSKQKGRIVEYHIGSSMVLNVSFAKFAYDEATANMEAKLTGITTTSLASDAFYAVALPATAFDAATVKTALGIDMSTLSLPTGITDLKVEKLANSVNLVFTFLSQGAEISYTSIVNKSTSDDSYLESAKALILTVTTTSAHDFYASAISQNDISIATLSTLGIDLTSLNINGQVRFSLVKSANDKTVNYVLKFGRWSEIHFPVTFTLSTVEDNAANDIITELNKLTTTTFSRIAFAALAIGTQSAPIDFLTDGTQLGIAANDLTSLIAILQANPALKITLSKDSTRYGISFIVTSTNGLITPKKTSVTISHFGAISQSDVTAEATRISSLQVHGLTATLASIEALSKPRFSDNLIRDADAYGLSAFTPNTGFRYTVSSTEIVSDGDFEVTVTVISEDNAAFNSVIKLMVPVTGIAAIHAQQNGVYLQTITHSLFSESYFDALTISANTPAEAAFVMLGLMPAPTLPFPVLPITVTKLVGKVVTFHLGSGVPDITATFSSFGGMDQVVGLLQSEFANKLHTTSLPSVAFRSAALPKTGNVQTISATLGLDIGLISIPTGASNLQLEKSAGGDTFTVWFTSGGIEHSFTNTMLHSSADRAIIANAVKQMKVYEYFRIQENIYKGVLSPSNAGTFDRQWIDMNIFLLGDFLLDNINIPREVEMTVQKEGNSEIMHFTASIGYWETSEFSMQFVPSNDPVKMKNGAVALIKTLTSVTSTEASFRQQVIGDSSNPILVDPFVGGGLAFINEVVDHTRIDYMLIPTLYQLAQFKGDLGYRVYMWKESGTADVHFVFKNIGSSSLDFSFVVTVTHFA